jgi:hypothetical protein
MGTGKAVSCLSMVLIPQKQVDLEPWQLLVRGGNRSQHHIRGSSDEANQLSWTAPQNQIA